MPMGPPQTSTAEQCSLTVCMPAVPFYPSSTLAVCTRELHAPVLLAKGTAGLEAIRLAVHLWHSTQHKRVGILQAEHSLELHLPYISYVMR